jgi:D-arginine dehydrogenase
MQFDFAIVGAGMAGASFAARIAGRASVLLLERESFPGYHTTGRSAAIFNALYGNEVIRSLTRASRAFYDAPAGCFTDYSLLTPRSIIHIGAESERRRTPDLLRSPGPYPISVAEARRLVPILRESSLACAVLDPSAADIDVHAVHQGFLRTAKAAGAVLATNAEVISLHRRAVWEIGTRAGTYRAGVIVNAAGAWADQLAQMAGAAPLHLRPLRRTAIHVDGAPGLDVVHWPCVIAIDESLYFKPQGQRLLATPCDATPTEPCDAQPDDFDIAVCVERIERATTLSVRRVTHAWAGLRTFAPDLTPVVGYDPQCEAFFWLAGQGGYGIQTAPALSEAAAALALREPLPRHIVAERLLTADLSPERLGSAARGEQITQTARST